MQYSSTCNWKSVDSHTAHARLMFRDEVTVEDAVVAVTLMESTMQVLTVLSVFVDKMLVGERCI